VVAKDVWRLTVNSQQPPEEAIDSIVAYMFRPAFREYIAKNFPKPAPAPVAAAS